MKQYIYTFLFIITALCCTAQSNKYVITLKDKNNSPFSVDVPAQFLSEKAIERRTKQFISINENDLPINPSYLSLIKETGAIILNKSKWLNTVVVSLEDPKLTLPLLEQLPFVQSATFVAKGSRPTANKSITVRPQQASNKSANVYGEGYNQIAMLHGDQLHELGFRGKGMTIAVLDAGFLNTSKLAVFDSLRAHNQIKGTYDFVDHDVDVYSEGIHGTNVLSTMAANMPGTFIGTAPEADYWLLRSEDDRSEKIIEEFNWVSAAEFADSVGADIINSSLGYTEFDDTSQNNTYADMDGKTTVCTRAANEAAAKGIIVVNSAGNEGNSSWRYIGAPADAFDILTIGAVDAAGNHASFSSVGPTADGRIKPTVSAQGLAAYVAKTDGTFGSASGTSFSSPIIAGMVACLWQSSPNKSNLDVMNKVIASAHKFTNPDNQLGYGIPNFYKAYQSITSIDNQVRNQHLNVYPNPFLDQIKVEYQCAENTNVLISLYNAMGQLMYQNTANAIGSLTNTFVLNTLPALKDGLYLLSVQDQNHTSRATLLKR